MEAHTHSPSSPRVPAIVKIVLREITKWCADGRMTHKTFEAQLTRLEQEELHPRRLSLLAREQYHGGTRFFIQDTAGATCEIIDCRHFAEESGSYAGPSEVEAVAA